MDVRMGHLFEKDLRKHPDKCMEVQPKKESN